MITFFKEIGLAPEMYEIGKDEIRIKGGDFAEVFPGQSILVLRANCDRLRSFPGFDRLIEGFQNPTQFSATVFEINCAIFCLDKYAATDLIFGIDVTVNGGKKRPDFEAVIGQQLKFLVECKSLQSINRVRSSRAYRIAKILIRDAAYTLPDQWRLEFSFSSLPHHWNRNLSDQIKGAVGVLLGSAYTAKSISLAFETGIDVSIKLCKRTDPFFFSGPVRAADTGPREQPKILVTEGYDFSRSIMGVFRDAITQLPSERPHMIFIYSISQVACEAAATRFFENQQRRNLLAIHSWTNNIARIWNPHCALSQDCLPLSS